MSASIATASIPASGLVCPCCGQADFETAFAYDAPPHGETRFDLRGQPYRREYRRCRLCGHFLSIHGLDLSALYSGAYVDVTYGSPEGMRRTFERIVSLPPERSDNAGRVRRLVEFAARRPLSGAQGEAPTLLDIGAGLGVFPWGMKQAGWSCTALDPDPRAAAHIRDAVGVAAVAADFLTVDPQELGTFDVVTFNKVLEHVLDPVAMLARALPLVRTGGFVYVELPDTAAAVAGKEREEFYIEHHHVFSPSSLIFLIERAGFSPVALERLREPSGKYTLRAFAEPVPPG